MSTATSSSAAATSTELASGYGLKPVRSSETASSAQASTLQTHNNTDSVGNYTQKNGFSINHRHSIAPIMQSVRASTSDSTQQLSNMLNRLSFSSGSASTGLPGGQSSNLASSNMASPAGANPNAGLHYMIKIRNIPNDVTLREAYVMFALSQSALVDIDVIQESSTGEKCIHVLWNSLNVALSNALLLDSKTTLFGPDFPFKSFIQLYDIQSQQQIPFNTAANLTSTASTPHRPSMIRTQTDPINLQQQQQQQQQQQHQQQQQRTLFSFNDPFGSRQSSVAQGSQQSAHLIPGSAGGHGNTSSLQASRDMMVPPSPFEDQSFSYDDVPSSASSASNIWNTSALNGSISNNALLASGNLDDSASLNVSRATTYTMPSAPSSSTISSRAPEWAQRSPSIYQNPAVSSNLDHSPSTAYKNSIYHNGRGPLDSNFVGSPLGKKIRENIGTQLPYNSSEVGNTQGLSPTSKTASLATNDSHASRETLKTNDSNETNTFTNKQSVPNAFAQIEGVTEEDLALLSKVPAPANPADQNPPCNTLYVGNLPPDATELELRQLFSQQKGFKRLSFRNKNNGNNHGPMCFVEFEDVILATRALASLYGSQLPRNNGSTHYGNKGGIRLSFSKNPLGVRSSVSAGSGPLANGSSRRSIAASASGAPTTMSVLSTLSDADHGRTTLSARNSVAYPPPKSAPNSSNQQPPNTFAS